MAFSKKFVISPKESAIPVLCYKKFVISPNKDVKFGKDSQKNSWYPQKGVRFGCHKCVFPFWSIEHTRSHSNFLGLMDLGVTLGAF